MLFIPAVYSSQAKHFRVAPPEVLRHTCCGVSIAGLLRPKSPIFYSEITSDEHRESQ